MIRVLTISLAILQGIMAQDILKKSSTLEPEDLNIFKWEFRQKTSLETVAVMRVEHIIAGVPVEVYESVNYWPDREKIGNLLIFNDAEPEAIKLPGGSTASFSVDKRSSGISEVASQVEGPDGVKRNAHQVTINGENEKIMLSFYSAPMEVYRKVLPDMPNPAKDGTDGFCWRYAITEGDYVISTSKDASGNTKVMVHKTNQENKPALDNP